MGCTDERLNYENFGQQSPSLIFSYLQFYENAHRQEANQNSITNAIFASGVFNGLGGKDSKPISPEDILPFPDLIKGDTPKVFTKKTFNMIIRLLKEKRIPPSVVAFLHALPEIQQKLIADGSK